MGRFNPGDTITIAAIIKSYDSFGKVTVTTTGDPCCPITLTVDQASTAVLVKAAVPPRPAPATIITHHGYHVYIVTDTDDLTKVHWDGTTSTGWKKWTDLNHYEVKILA